MITNLEFEKYKKQTSNIFQGTNSGGSITLSTSEFTKLFTGTAKSDQPDETVGLTLSISDDTGYFFLDCTIFKDKKMVINSLNYSLQHLADIWIKLNDTNFDVYIKGTSALTIDINKIKYTVDANSYTIGNNVEDATAVVSGTTYIKFNVPQIGGSGRNFIHFRGYAEMYGDDLLYDLDEYISTDSGPTTGKRHWYSGGSMSSGGVISGTHTIQAAGDMHMRRIDGDYDQRISLWKDALGKIELKSTELDGGATNMFELSPAVAKFTLNENTPLVVERGDDTLFVLGNDAYGVSTKHIKENIVDIDDETVDDLFDKIVIKEYDYKKESGIIQKTNKAYSLIIEDVIGNEYFDNILSTTPVVVKNLDPILAEHLDHRELGGGLYEVSIPKYDIQSLLALTIRQIQILKEDMKK